MGMFTSISSSGLEEYSLLARAGLAWVALASGKDCLRKEVSLVEGDMVEVFLFDEFLWN